MCLNKTKDVKFKSEKKRGYKTCSLKSTNNFKETVVQQMLWNTEILLACSKIVWQIWQLPLRAQQIRTFLHDIDQICDFWGQWNFATTW